MAILQEVAIGNVTFWMLIGYTSVLLGIIATIAGFIKAFSTKANKKDVDDLKIEVNKKANECDMKELEAAIQQLRIRHEQINTEVILEISKQITQLDKKFEMRFNNLTTEIINILKTK